MPKQFLADTLSKFVERSGYSVGQIARLASVPRRSLANWVTGRVKRPRHTADLLKVAKALRLNSDEVEQLLVSAEINTTLADLLLTTSPADPLFPLLAPWRQPHTADSSTHQQQKLPPFQAIRDLPYFVGRSDEIGLLSQKLNEPNTLCVIQGMGGVGKSTLAAHLAYKLRDEFADGVLWAKVTDSDTMAILYSFAAAYGRDVSNFTDLQTRSQVVRDILASKRALIVLDDVAFDEEIAPLLPQTNAQCIVLVTTRRLDLASLLGAFWYQLSTFNAERLDSLNLYAKIVGDAAVQAEKTTFQQLASLLGHLPLAIAISAGRIATDPFTTAISFLTYLKQTNAPTSKLDYGKDNLTTTFDLSYGWLSPVEQQIFACLGLFPVEDIFVEALAATTKTSVAQINQTLQKLYRLSLVQTGGVEQYRLHPLVHDYAAQRERLDDNYVERMVVYLIEFVEANEHEYPKIATVLNHVLSALAHAHEMTSHGLYFRGVFALFPYLTATGQKQLADHHLSQTKLLAIQAHDKMAHAHSLWGLAENVLRRDSVESVTAQLQQALDLIKNDPPCELLCNIYESLGYSQVISDSASKAIQTLKTGLSVCKSILYVKGESRILARLAIGERRRGNYDEAMEYARHGLEIAYRLESKELVYRLLRAISVIYQDLGEYKISETYARECLQLALELNNADFVCNGQLNLAAALQNQGQYSPAYKLIESGLKLALEIGNQRMQAYCLNAKIANNRMRGRLDGIRQDVAKGLSIVLTNNYQRLIPTYYNHTIWLDIRSGAYDKAESVCHDALIPARASGYPRNELRLLCSLSEVYIRSKQFDHAIETVALGLSIAEQDGLLEFKLDMLVDRLRIQIALGKFDLASQNVKLVDSLLNREKHPVALAVLMECQGNLKMTQQEWSGAVAFYQTALEILRALSFYDLQAELMFRLSRAYISMGDIELGVDFGRKSYDMFHSTNHIMANNVRDWLLTHGIDVSQPTTTIAESLIAAS